MACKRRTASPTACTSESIRNGRAYMHARVCLARICRKQPLRSARVRKRRTADRPRPSHRSVAEDAERSMDMTWQGIISSQYLPALLNREDATGRGIRHRITAEKYVEVPSTSAEPVLLPAVGNVSQAATAATNISAGSNPCSVATSLRARTAAFAAFVVIGDRSTRSGHALLRYLSPTSSRI